MKEEVDAVERAPERRSLYYRFAHASPMVHALCSLGVVAFAFALYIGTYLFVTTVILGEDWAKVHVFNSLHPGMSKPDVLDRLGEPEKILPGDDPIVVDENLPGSGLTRLSPYRHRSVEAAGGAWVYWNDHPIIECHVFFDDTDTVQEVVVTNRD